MFFLSLTPQGYQIHPPSDPRLSREVGTLELAGSSARLALNSTPEPIVPILSCRCFLGTIQSRSTREIRLDATHSFSNPSLAHPVKLDS